MTIEEQKRHPLNITLSIEAAIWVTTGLYRLYDMTNNDMLWAMAHEINNSMLRHYGFKAVSEELSMLKERYKDCVFGEGDGI